MSVSDEWEKIVREATLEELARMQAVRHKRKYIDPDSFSKAEIVDFSALIYQHFRNLIYFEDSMTMNRVFGIIFTATCFPKLTFDTCTEVIREGNGREESEQIFKKLCERVKQIDLFTFASRFDFYNVSFYRMAQVPRQFKEMQERYKLAFQTTEKTRHHIRLKMISFISKPLLSIQAIQSDISNILFDYHVLKSGNNFFDGLIVSLTGRRSDEVLNELETKIRLHYFPNGDLVISDKYDCVLKQDMKNCIIDGSFESIKFLVEICSNYIRLDFETLEIAFFSRQFEILQYFFDRFWGKWNTVRKQNVLKLAARHTPFEFFKSVFFRCSEFERNYDYRSLQYSAIVGNHFLAFDFLVEHTPLSSKSNIDQYYREILVLEALKIKLPENKMRDYMNHFGRDLLDDSSYRFQLFKIATSTGQLDFIVEYKLNETSEKVKASVLTAAASKNRKLTPSIMFVIDSYQPRLDDNLFFKLIRALINCSSRDILQYLIEKVFGKTISAESKAQIFIFFVIQLQFFDCFSEARANIVKFCMMMGWTKSQINYTGEESQFSNSFGCIYITSKTWAENRTKIDECFASITDC